MEKGGRGVNPMMRALRLPNEVEGDLKKIFWDSYDAWGPFLTADGKERSKWTTTVKAVWDATHLYLNFSCEDDRIYSDFTRRDEPLYEQEVIEVFAAPFDLDLYYEFNVSPKDVVFDSLIRYADGSHHGDPSWDCVGLQSAVTWKNQRYSGDWEAFLAIPWVGLEVLPPRRGDRWAVNFYRIKRQGTDEFSCWSPTLTDPANFHVPERFGVLWFDE